MGEPTKVISFTIHKPIRLHVPLEYFDSKTPLEWALDCVEKFAISVYDLDIHIDHIDEEEGTSEFFYEEISNPRGTMSKIGDCNL